MKTYGNGASTKRLRIGIVDDQFYSLQERLLREGHEVFILVPGENFSSPIDGKDFNVTRATKWMRNGREVPTELTHVISLAGFIEHEVDFVITGTNDDEQSYEYLTAMGIPVLGHSSKSTMMELNRTFTRHFVEKMLDNHAELKSLLKLPEQREFFHRDELVEFLEDTEDKWVIKQSARSRMDVVANRTVVIDDPTNFIPYLSQGNPWFSLDGAGGCVLEEFVEGQEVCFGRWFTGNRMIGPVYSCIEHKGAQNGDRGFILTGEVGTTIKMHAEDTAVAKMFDVLSMRLFAHRMDCCGLIDINTILDADGKLNFVEFTMRFGRPTLEVMLFHSNDEFDWGHGLFSLCNDAIPADQKSQVWAKAYPMDKISIGVTTFSYGYPFLEFWNALPLDKAVIELLNNNIPYRNLTIDQSNHPYLTMDNGVQQLFARFKAASDEWEFQANERHLTFCGKGDTVEDAQREAYKFLRAGPHGYNVLGQTWRDDIGDNLETLYAAFEKYNIA